MLCFFRNGGETMSKIVDANKKIEKAVVGGYKKVEGSVVDIASKEVARAISNAPEDLEKLQELAEFIKSDPTGAAALSTKVDNNSDRIATLEASGKEIVIISESHYELLPEKEDKLYFLYEE